MSRSTTVKLLSAAAIAAMLSSASAQTNPDPGNPDPAGTTTGTGTPPGTIPPGTPGTDAPPGAGGAGTDKTPVPEPGSTETPDETMAGTGQVVDDSTYVLMTGMSDMYEIQAAAIAAEKAQSAEVKELAMMISADHTAASQELQTLVAGAGGTLPATLDEDHQKMVDDLASANGAAFDMLYVEQQIAGHTKALAMQQSYAQNGENAELKAHAAKVAPKIEMHLQMAEKLKAM